MSLDLFPPRSKIADSNGVITPEFYRGLRDLVYRVGGAATTSLVTMAEFLLLKARVLVLETNQVLTKQTIVDLGSTYVYDSTINVIDADVTINSLLTAQIAPIADGYTRPIEEVIYEKITIQPIPKAGSIDFYIQPERGHIQGLYAITYTVAL